MSLVLSTIKHIQTALAIFSGSEPAPCQGSPTGWTKMSHCSPSFTSHLPLADAGSRSYTGLAADVRSWSDSWLLTRASQDTDDFENFRLQTT